MDEYFGYPSLSILVVLAGRSLVSPWKVISSELWDSLGKNWESFVYGLLRWVLFTGKDPNVVNLAKENIIASIDKGKGFVISCHDSVVSGGAEPEELNSALRTIAPGSAVSSYDLLGWVVELGVEDSEGTVSIDRVSGLLTVAVLEGRVLVLTNLEPGANIPSSIEILLERRGSALAPADTGVNWAD